MKQRIARLAMVFLALSLTVGLTFTACGVLTGCASNSVAEGHDPFVVEAEKDIRTAFHVVDGFLAWENTNRAVAGPEVTAFADTLRLSFPDYLTSAQSVLRAYKENRTAEGRASVMTWLETLNAAMLRAVQHLPEKDAKVAYRAAGNPVK